MPDEKQTRVVGPIQKWIGLAIMALTLIGAIYLRMLWKFISLLLVLFLAGALLPKSVQKWFWRAALAIIIVLVIWVFLPDSDDWKPYTFDKELAAVEAKRAIPDEENTALFYNLLLENYDKKQFEPNFSNPDIYKLSLSCPWTSKEYPEMAEWLKSQKDTIDILMLACQKQNCRFPINADILSPPDLESQTYAMGNWGQLLIRVANNELAEGYTKKAIKIYTDAIRLAEHEYQQTTAIDFLIGRNIACRTIDRLISFIVNDNSTEENLNTIENAVTEINYDWQSDFTNILNHEKLLSKTLWAQVFYETNQQGNVRCTYNTPERLPFLRKTAIEQSYWQKRAHRAATVFCWFFLPSRPETLAKTVDSVFEKYYQMTEPDFNWKKDPNEFSFKFKYRWNPRILIELTAGIMRESYYKIHDVYLKAIAQQKGCRLIIAMRRYKNKTGHWPESLDEIKDLVPAEAFVDPLNNGSFVYKLTQDNFTLYSRGKNNIDENGKNERLSGGIQGQDDWPIWPEPKCK